MTRPPPAMWSMVASCLAKTAALRNSGGVTREPSRTRSVTAATAASWDQASRMGISGAGTPYRWSHTHNES
jgi:hypothetical protein